jgi:hypothetical protein
MVGITLSPEQIRRAPPEVRRWLQDEIAASLGVGTEPAPASELAHLATCSVEDAAAIYERIRGALPLANVFFELGRGGEFVTPEGLIAHRLADMLRHSRLQTMEQLSACLQLINRAAGELSGDPEISIYAIDPRGYCLTLVDTQRSIAALWEQLMSQPDLTTAEAAQEAGKDPRKAKFPSLRAILPAEAVHMGAPAP